MFAQTGPRTLIFGSEWFSRRLWWHPVLQKQIENNSCGFIFVFCGYSLPGNMWVEWQEWGIKGKIRLLLLCSVGVFGNSFTILFPILRLTLWMKKLHLPQKWNLYYTRTCSKFSFQRQHLPCASNAVSHQNCFASCSWCVMRCCFCGSFCSGVIMFRFVALLSHLSLFCWTCNGIWIVFYKFGHFETGPVLTVAYQMFCSRLAKKKGI